MSAPPLPPSSEATPHPNWLQAVNEQVAGLRFGSVSLTIHDGRVTQIETLEKIRLVGPANSTPAADVS